MVGWARSLCQDKLIITDDLWGTALRSYISGGGEVSSRHYPDEDFRRLVTQAFWAGNDMLMITYPEKVKVMQAALQSLVRKDPQARKRMDESVRRILLAKEKLGLIQVSRAAESTAPGQ